MQSSQIPVKFSALFANAASASFIRPIPTASQIGITPGAASLADGFPPLNFVQKAAGGIPISGKDFNGLQNQVTAWLRWQCAGVSVAFDAAFSTAIGGYPAGSVLQSAANPTAFWLSQTENNVTNPDTGGAGWVLFGPQSVQDGRFSLAITGGTSLVYTATLTPAPLALVNGMSILAFFGVMNTTTTPTLNINGLGAKNIIKKNLLSLQINDLSGWINFIYDSVKNVFIVNGNVFSDFYQRIPSGTSFYVNPSIGSDTNDGFANVAGRAFATIQGAVDTIIKNYSCNYINLVCSDSLIYKQISINYSNISFWNIVGNVTANGNCLIDATQSISTNCRGIVCNFGVAAKISGFKILSYLENAVAIGNLEINNCTLTPPILVAYPIGTQPGGSLKIYGTIKFLGSFLVGISGSGGLILCGSTDGTSSNPITFDVTGASFTTAFIDSFSFNVSRFYPTVTAFIGTATGVKFTVASNGSISVQGAGINFLPGNAPGTVAPGGYYG